MLASKGSFRVRSSKFRHIYGDSFKKESWYDNLQLGKSANEGTICNVNPQFLAIAVGASGGSAFIVHPLSATGRVDANEPKCFGHKGPVVDLKFNPFDDYLIASASDDATVRIWRIPEFGALHNITNSVVDLHCHHRRVSQIEWHPAASNILVSIGQDNEAFVWNVEHEKPVTAIKCHTDAVYSVAWNRDGSLLATTCRDRLLRLVDPRTGACVDKLECHESPKSSRCTFVNDNTVLTTGVSRSSDREFVIWQLNGRSNERRLAHEPIDTSNGILMPFYDPDLRLLFLAGKGDSNIRFYELTNDAPYYHAVGQYSTNAPQQAIGSMPKRGLDFRRCEIMRFYKLHATAGCCEPISIIVPRRHGNEMLQGDIYPPVPAARPALSSSDWLAGVNRMPTVSSVRDLLEGRVQEPELPSMIDVPRATEQHLSVQKASAQPTDVSLSARVHTKPANNVQETISSAAISPTPKRSTVVVTISPSARAAAQKQQRQHDAAELTSSHSTETVNLSVSASVRPRPTEDVGHRTVENKTEHVVQTLLTPMDQSLRPPVDSNVQFRSNSFDQLTLVEPNGKDSHSNGHSVEMNADADGRDEDLPPVAAFIRNSPFYASLNNTVTTLRSYRAAPTQARRKAEDTSRTASKPNEEQQAQPAFANVRLRAAPSRHNNQANVANRYSVITLTPDVPMLGRSDADGDHQNFVPDVVQRSEVDRPNVAVGEGDTIRILKEEVALRDKRIAELEAQVHMLERQIAQSTNADGAHSRDQPIVTSTRVVNVKRVSVGASEA